MSPALADRFPRGGKEEAAASQAAILSRSADQLGER